MLWTLVNGKGRMEEKNREKMKKMKIEEAINGRFVYGFLSGVTVNETLLSYPWSTE